MRLQQWLAELRARDGERLLRLKGVVRIADEQDPLLLHGVHHLFHPPLRAPAIAWPPERSTLVLILRSLRPPEAAALRAAFAGCIA
jgi:G3E family GTPase